MKPIRAIIFDVYKTLLHVAPPEGDLEARWKTIYQTHLGGMPECSHPLFLARCREAVQQQHVRAATAGILHPEVDWKQVVESAIPASRELPDPSDFHEELASLTHHTSLMPGAETLLKALRSGGPTLGIASNAQGYSIRELRRHLQGVDLDLNLFDEKLCLWSFEQGFSKPNPHIFRILSVRLALRGLLPEQILLVGDRLDNDIFPALAQGWQTWHVTETPAENPGGTLQELTSWLEMPD